MVWPKRYGGHERRRSNATCCSKSCSQRVRRSARIGCRSPVGAEPVALRLEEQRQKYLPGMARGEIRCIGVGTGAGSDLARAHARREAPRRSLAINGQKIWTSKRSRAGDRLAHRRSTETHAAEPAARLTRRHRISRSSTDGTGSTKSLDDVGRADAARVEAKAGAGHERTSLGAAARSAISPASRARLGPDARGLERLGIDVARDGASQACDDRRDRLHDRSNGADRASARSSRHRSARRRRPARDLMRAPSAKLGRVRQQITDHLREPDRSASTFSGCDGGSNVTLCCRAAISGRATSSACSMTSCTPDSGAARSCRGDAARQQSSTRRARCEACAADAAHLPHVDGS